MHPLRQILIVAAAVSAIVAFPAAAAASSKASTSETALLNEINHVRAAHGLHALVFDPTLARAARAHTAEMSSTGVFEHGSFQTRMLQFGVHGPLVGENLAWGSGSYGQASTIVREWLASPAHRANLLHTGWTRIGIGLARGTFLGNGGSTVVTADFAGR
jgi:uncharacterized protein YkwD